MSKKVKIIMMRAVGVMLVLLIAYGIYFILPSKSGPEITEVPNISSKEIKNYFPMESEATVKDMVHQVERAKEKQAPQYHYYTITQKEADDKAEEYGKAQKADKVIKEFKETEVKDDIGNKTSVIENDYYGINLERKHRIKAGAAVVGESIYMKASYQNRDIEYEIYHSPKTGKTSIGVEIAIAKW